MSLDMRDVKGGLSALALGAAPLIVLVSGITLCSPLICVACLLKGIHSLNEKKHI